MVPTPQACVVLEQPWREEELGFAVGLTTPWAPPRLPLRPA